MAGPGWVANLAKALETYDWVAGAIEVQRLNPNYLAISIYFVFDTAMIL
jgi:hypothetical protein